MVVPHFPLESPWEQRVALPPLGVNTAFRPERCHQPGFLLDSSLGLHARWHFYCLRAGLFASGSNPGKPTRRLV